MASHAQQIPFGIGAGGVYGGGVPPSLLGPQAGRFQPMGFNFGQQQRPLQPLSPNVSGAAGFQHIIGRDVDTLMCRWLMLRLNGVSAADCFDTILRHWLLTFSAHPLRNPDVLEVLAAHSCVEGARTSRTKRHVAWSDSRTRRHFAWKGLILHSS